MCDNLNYSLRIEHALRKLNDSEFLHIRDEIILEPYTVLSDALVYMYNLNKLQKDDQFTKSFIEKINYFKGRKFEDIKLDFLDDFVIELENIVN